MRRCLRVKVGVSLALLLLPCAAEAQDVPLYLDPAQPTDKELAVGRTGGSAVICRAC